MSELHLFGNLSDELVRSSQKIRAISSVTDELVDKRW